MNPVAFHFASGDALFSGSAAILLSCGISWRSPNSKKLMAGRLLAVVGLLMVSLSAIPLPYWFYAIWIAAGICWLVVMDVNPGPKRWRFMQFAGATLFLCSLAGPDWEIAWRSMQHLQEGRWSELAVIGDSISAGMLGPEEVTWPEVFRESFHTDVFDASHVGATARSAAKQSDSIPRDELILLIQIGGNDVLGITTASEFERHLTELLRRSQRPGRQMVMLELPLPPFYNEYGRIQRDLARRFHVAMIPRRETMRVLATDGATLDGLHLSSKGHRLMAEMIWRWIGVSLETQPRPSLAHP